MRTIWKFPLETTDRQEVDLPNGARILHIDGQVSGTLTLWALVDPTAGKGGRVVRIYGTGHPISDLELLDYLGTVSMPSGLVWHVFEELKL